MLPSERPLQNKPLLKALGLAWQLGYTIAVPLVILALLGRLLDKQLNTSPLFLLVGVVISVFVTTWLIYRKIIAIVPPSRKYKNIEKNNQTEHPAQ